MLDLNYIAGLIDADGSINISVSRNRYKSKTGKETIPQIAFTVNIRQVPQYRYILEEIRETLGVGLVYEHRSTSKTATAMTSWQTTKHEETLYVCNLIGPLLKIKQKEAMLMVEALTLWLENPGKKKGVGFSRPEWVRNKIIEISSQMNPSQQKETSRRNKEIRELECRCGRPECENPNHDHNLD